MGRRVTPKGLVLVIFLLLLVPLGSAAPDNSADVLHYTIDFTIKPDIDMVFGKTAINIDMQEAEKLELRLDKNLKLTSVQANDAQVTYTHDQNRVTLSFERPLSGAVNLRLVYEGRLDVEMDGHSWAYMDKDGAYGVYEAYWYPQRIGDRAKGTITLHLPDSWMGISNGELIETADGLYVWNDYSQDVGFSFAAGRYSTRETLIGHLPVTCYLLDPESACEARLEEMVEYYTSTLTEYPFPKLAVVEVKGNLNGGHSDHSLIILSTNILNGPQYDEFLAHELAHNWFGSIVTSKDVEEGKDQWITEGFATYLSIMYLESKDRALATKSLDEKRREYLFVKDNYGDIKISSEKEEYEGSFSLNGLNHATVYSKGAWVLHMLRYVTGDELFMKILHEYLQEYQWKSASITDFKDMVEKVSNRDFEWFFTQWIDSTSIPDFQIGSVDVTKKNNRYTTTVFIKQKDDPVATLVDVTMALSPKERVSKTVWVDADGSAVEFESESPPIYVEVDKGRWILERDKTNNRHIIRYPLSLYGLKLFLSNIVSV